MAQSAFAGRHKTFVNWWGHGSPYRLSKGTIGWTSSTP